MEKEYLAMYDVRGIQNYIFRSNDLQEIIGASNLVENIIIDGLESIITGQSDWNREEFLTDWKNDNGTEFIDDNSVKMQVLFRWWKWICIISYKKYMFKSEQTTC